MILSSHFQIEAELASKLLVESAKRVLVVDDEEFCLSSMKAMLQKAGLDIYH